MQRGKPPIVRGICKDEDGTGERLNLVIDLHAKRALERLATCYGVTQREALERLVLDAERAALDKVAAQPADHADYYSGRLRLGLDVVTQ